MEPSSKFITGHKYILQDHWSSNVPNNDNRELEKKYITSGTTGDLALVGEEAGDTPPAGESGRARLRGGPGVCSVDGRTAREEGSPIVFFGTVSEDPFKQ